MPIAPREIGRTVALASQAASGALGPASISTDTRVIVVAQTTEGMTFTLPSPSDTSAVVGLDVENSGTASFTLYGATVQPSTFVRCVWSGSAWNISAGEIGGTQIVTGTSATVAAGMSMVYVNNPSAAVAIAGPSPPITGEHFTIKDGSRNAATNNVTYTPGSGITIEGAPSVSITVNGGGLNVWIISPTVQILY